ncbi:MAG: hypothetical protein JOZ81_25485, partial [Chloroflexi bacterium]|nr:hypothetical protein [Chloroflexota bacterium]
MRVRHYVYLAVTALVITALAAVFSMSAQAQTATRAFYGPFPSWRQVKCEGADDTAMLQNELNVLGNPGHSPVLYINPGTCRLTATLHIDQEHGGCRYGGVSILGADPATTKMLWAGPSDINQPMLSWGCMFDSRFGRLTWDGGGRAVTVYWQSQLPEYSSTNRHEDEFFVNLDPNGVAIRSGGQGVGDAEVEYLREHFIGPMQAGMLLYDYNSVDHWVHNSEFIGPMEAGVANFVSTQNGAGNFGIDHSNFINVTADAQLANPGFFTTTGNYSRGNHWHVHALASGSAAATWTSLSETIIDPDPTQSQFEFGNPGPLFVGDLHLRSSRDREGISRVVEGYTGNPGGDTSSIGNTSSASGGGQYNVPIPGLGRDFTNSGELYGLDDHPGQSISDPGPYTIMTPSRSTLPVIEVQNGDIASALSQAGSQHVIVHVPFGQYVPS